MAVDKKNLPGIDNSDSATYPHGRTKDDTGAGDGFRVNALSGSDIWEFFGRVMDLAQIAYSNQFDNSQNGYQLVDAVQALAGKNDYRYNLGSTTTLDGGGNVTALGNLTLPDLALHIMSAGETAFAIATVKYNAEVQITGSKIGYTKNIAGADPFEIGDLLLLVNTNAGLQIVLFATSANISRMGLIAGFLKAATNNQDITGIATNVATTPASNLAAFTYRVNGADSASFLATTLVNGLLSKEDKQLLNRLQVRNVGRVSNIDPGGMAPGTNLPAQGDAVSAVVQSLASADGNESSIKVTFANAMLNINYYVRMYVESTGNLGLDNDTYVPVFKPFDTTSFLMVVNSLNGVQNLRIHFEVVQLTA